MLQHMNFAIQFGHDWTENHQGVGATGYITDLIIDVPDFKNKVAGRLSIHDDDGNEIYGTKEEACGKVHVITNLHVPVVMGFTVRYTLSGVPDSDGTVKSQLFIDV